MNAFRFLAEWAIRSSILIFAGALLIWAIRFKDPAIRLAAWIALLMGSLLIPVMMTILPVLPVHLLSSAAPVQAILSVSTDFFVSSPAAPLTAATQPVSFFWYRAALILYANDAAVR